MILTNINSSFNNNIIIKLYKDILLIILKMTEENNDMNIENSNENDIRYIGRVNWFNRRKGFGFICIITPNIELTNTDVFFHFSEISTNNYKIVYPGEYVSVTLGINTSDGQNRTICKNITGVYGNDLLTDNSKYSYRITEKKQVSNKSVDESVDESVDKP